MKSKVRLTGASAIAAVAVAAFLSAAAAPLPAAAQVGSAASAPAKAAPTRQLRNDVETRISRLQQRLEITPEQMSQWNAVAQAMRDNAHEVRELAQARAQNAATMSAVDDLRSYEEINEAHVESIKKLLPPFDALYASMSDAQKKNADAVFAGFEHRHKGHERRSS